MYTPTRILPDALDITRPDAVTKIIVAAVDATT
jgi:hypothetical protein